MRKCFSNSSRIHSALVASVFCLGWIPVSGPVLIACDDARFDREGVIAAEVMPVDADHGYSVESVCGVDPEVPTESERVEIICFSAVSDLATGFWAVARWECE